MSRHFGRNRRRKLESECARLRAAHAMDAALLNDMDAKNERLRAIIARIEAIVGPHFAGFPPKSVYLGCPPNAYSWKVERTRPLRPESLAGDTAFVERPVLETVTLWRLEADCTLVDGAVHVRLQYMSPDGPRSTYMLSEQALLEMPLPALVEEIAPAMLAKLREYVQHGSAAAARNQGLPSNAKAR